MAAASDFYEPPEFLDENGVVTEPPWRRRALRNERRYHLAMLGCGAAVLLTAALLQVRPDQRVGFVFAPDRPLPELCQMKVVYGIPCPGCGLTRCFVHAVHGDLTSAASANVAGLLLVALVIAQFPYRGWRLLRPTDREWPIWSFVLILSIPPTALILQWIVRLYWLRGDLWT